MASGGPGTGAPAPPPEAVLLRVVRKASGITLASAAKAAGISKAWLSSIENGYDSRGPEGGIRPVRASDDIVARLAAFLNISPERLEAEGRRPDAAAVLREMQRDRPAQGGDALDEALRGEEFRDFTPGEIAAAKRWILFQRAEAEREDRERNRRGA